MSHALKILIRLIYRRMEKNIEENLQGQFGFQTTREAILSLRIIMEKTDN